MDEFVYRELSVYQCDKVIQLFYHSFKDADGIDEATSVSGLVDRYLIDFPRNDLKGYAAFHNDQIIGCVFFSKLYFPRSNKQVFILSPMAIKTDFQGKGIGKELISYAHEKLREEGVNIVTTYGDINFYAKAGYELVSEESIAAPHKLTYPEGWLGYALDGVSDLRIKGPSSCIKELNDPHLW